MFKHVGQPNHVLSLIGAIFSLCIVAFVALFVFVLDQTPSHAANSGNDPSDEIVLNQAGCGGPRQPTCTPQPPPTATRPTNTPGPTNTPKDPTNTRTFTPSLTPTPSRTSTPSITPTPTDTRTVTPSSTSTSTATSTATRTFTLTPTPTPTNTPTGCLLPNTAAATPTGTSAATNPVTPGTANHIVISEIRTCGPNGGADEFIELHNPTNASVDLSNWEIRVSDHTGVIKTGVTIKPGTLIYPGQHFLMGGVRYSGAVTPDQPLTVGIEDDGGVALVMPNGSIVDQVGMSGGSAFKENIPLAPLFTLSATSYERKAGGDAGNCVDTDNNANDFQNAPSNPQALTSPVIICPRAGSAGNLTAGSSVQSNFFVDNIRKPSDLQPINVAVVVTNILLALLLALIMTAASTVLNDVIESSEGDLARWFAPIVALFQGLGHALRALDANFNARGLAWLATALKLAAMFVLYGMVFAFIDPHFNLFSADGWSLILALAVSVGLVSIIDDIAQFIFLRQRGENAMLRVHSVNLLLAGLTTGVSKFVGLAPGIIFGSPAGLEGVDSPRFESTLHLIAILATGAAALIAWALTPLVTANAWLSTVMLLTFGAGIQTVFFEMLPISFLHGNNIFKTNKLLWFAIFAIVTAIFMQTMLNPDGAFLSAFESANMQTLTIIVAAFCAFTAVVWFYFGRKHQAATP